MSRLLYRSVSKVFDQGRPALDGLDLDIADGEFIVLVGPSGCGKSTALRLLAGLEKATAGEIVIDDTIVNDLPPGDRDVAMVFQNYALYPHLTVGQNIAFGLHARGMRREEIRRRVHEISRVLELQELLTRKPKALSGGQRQRVAMGRAMVREPRAFLMDEPLSNLDARLRVEMRGEIVRLQEELGTTTIYVTHDQAEAMTMGHRVAVLRDGRLQQLDAPQTVYDKPANTFVAGFIGSPPMSLAAADVVRNGRLELAIGDSRIPLPTTRSGGVSGIDAHAGGAVVVGLRAENLELVDPGSAGPSLLGRVTLVEVLGAETIVHVEIANARGVLDGAEGPQVDHKPPVVATRVHKRTRPELNAPVALQLDPEELVFFDPASGRALP